MKRRFAGLRFIEWSNAVYGDQSGAWVLASVTAARLLARSNHDCQGCHQDRTDWNPKNGGLVSERSVRCGFVSTARARGQSPCLATRALDPFRGLSAGPATRRRLPRASSWMGGTAQQTYGRYGPAQRFRNQGRLSEPFQQGA